MRWRGFLLPAVTVFAAAGPGQDLEVRKLGGQFRDTLRELRELREGYYRRREERRRKVERARSQVRSLRSEVKRLESESDRLSREREEMEAQLSTLAARKEAAALRAKEIEGALAGFTRRLRSALREGIPYRRDARLRRLKGIEGEGPLSERVGRLWSFFREELRIARSGETYTQELVLPDGRRKPARLVRVGKHFLGFVTEDGLDAGVWLPPGGWTTDPGRFDPESVRRAVEILDRKRAPEWLPLPVPLFRRGGG